MKELVCEGISVSEQFQRNRNFRVSRIGRGGFFVKQSDEWSEWGQRHSTLVREAACYQLASGNTHLEKLIPKFHDFSTRSHVLVVGLVEPARSMADMHSETGAFPPVLAALLGKQLAVCHVEFGKMLRFLDREHPFIGEVPWILKPDDLNDYISDSQSPGQARLVGIMQKTPQLYHQLKALADTWRINGIIHGDMKWHNCLLQTAEDDADLRAATIRIVDWELADAGHVAWDVAGILQGYLSQWINSMNFSEGGTVEEIAADGGTPAGRDAAFDPGFLGELYRATRRARRGGADVAPPQRRVRGCTYAPDGLRGSAGGVAARRSRRAPDATQL